MGPGREGDSSKPQYVLQQGPEGGYVGLANRSTKVPDLEGGLIVSEWPVGQG